MATASNTQTQDTFFRATKERIDQTVAEINSLVDQTDRAKGKLIALENSLLAMGYSSYQPIASSFSTHSTFAPSSSQEESKSGSRGRPKGSKNKPKEGQVEKAAKPISLTGAIINAFTASSKQGMGVIEITNAVKSYCEIDAKSTDVLKAINQMLENGTMIYDDESKTYRLAV